MEDIKKIQEFFSKPLEENKVTKEDFNKVVKVLSASKYPFTIMLVPKWDEIDIITGQDSPDEIVDDIIQKLNSAGLNWGGNSGITISGDSSNYSRKEYSDIFRVNGGHKNYFEESVNEGGIEDIQKKLDALGVKYEMSKTDKVRPFKAIYRPVNKSDEFYDKFEDIVDLANLKGVVKTSMNEERKLTYDDFVSMVRADMNAGSASDEYVSDERVKKDAKWKYNEYLQGASIDDLFEYNSGIYFNPDESSPRPKVKDGAKSGVEKVKDILKKIVKEHETDPNLELKVGDYQTQHFHMCPGAKSLYQDIEDKVEDMGLAIRSAKLQDALFAMEESALKNGANEADVFAAETIADQIMAMAAMMGLDKEHSYIQGHVDKIKDAVDKEQVDEGASTEEKRMAMQAIKRFAKYRGVSEKEAKADLIRAVKELGSIEEAINEIVETIQAGKVLEEKLCDKGKRYIKARQAAGEKSSAYLSGRAVRVCKGQIEWPKKEKKKK